MPRQPDQGGRQGLQVQQAHHRPCCKGLQAYVQFFGMTTKSPFYLFLILSLLGCTSPSTDPDPGLAARELPVVDRGSMKEGDTPPRPIHMEVPDYPDYLKEQRISGTVMVYFEVAEDGRVTDAFAADSPHPGLSEAAVSAIMKSKFEPALVDGVPAVSQMSVPVRFDLD